MNVSLIISVVGNIFLFLLLLLFLVLYFTTYPKGSQNTPCPAPTPAPPTTICTDASCNYIIKTIDGKYLNSCLNCNYNADYSVVASNQYSGDTVQFIGSGNSFQVKMNIATDPSGVYFFKMIPQSLTQSVLKLTQNPNDKGTMFNLVPYVFSFSNNMGSNLYQIGNPLSNTLLGVDQPSCLTKEGLPIIDGYNFYINAPNGLNQNSLFLILPSLAPQPLLPINPPTENIQAYQASMPSIIENMQTKPEMQNFLEFDY
jgi:hypothetical protein